LSSIVRHIVNELIESGIDPMEKLSKFAVLLSVINEDFSKLATIGSALRPTFGKFVLIAAVTGAHFSESSARTRAIDRRSCIELHDCITIGRFGTE
jgi:hypothetical protein